MNKLILLTTFLPSTILTAATSGACVSQCGNSNLTCLSKCLGLPNPSDDQANATTDCNSQCSGSGTDAQACFNNCVKSFFSNSDMTSISSSASSTSTSSSSTASSTSSSSSTKSSDSSTASNSSKASSKPNSMSKKPTNSNQSSKGGNYLNDDSHAQTTTPLTYLTPVTLSLAILSIL